MSIILIAGSRSFNDWEVFHSLLQEIKFKHEIKSIISGGAKGADTLAENMPN